MSAPVTPSTFSALIITPGSNFCFGFIRLLLRLPVEIKNLVTWMLDSSGNVTNGFRNQLWPAGSIITTASSRQPDGDWLFCNGQAVSRSTYAALFSEIGTTFGAGDGSTTFNIPDLRDRFVVGAGAGYNRGQTGGEATHVLTMAELPAAEPPTATGITTFITQGSVGAGASVTTGGGSFQATPVEDAFNNLGSGTAHNNLPPYLALNHWIKT